MLGFLFSQTKWLGVLSICLAMLFAEPLKHKTSIDKPIGAAPAATAATNTASVRGKETPKPAAAPSPHQAVGQTAAPASDPVTADLEDGELFANIDKELDRFTSVEVVATGYSAGKESTGKTPGHPEYGITYSGVKVRKDTFSTIAADTRVFPLGTVLYIPGYGFGVVADTGSKIKGHKIDLYFKTKSQVYEQWGKKTVRVYVLKRGEGKVTEAMLDRLNSLKTVPVGKQTSSASKAQ